MRQLAAALCRAPVGRRGARLGRGRGRLFHVFLGVRVLRAHVVCSGRYAVELIYDLEVRWLRNGARERWGVEVVE